MQDTAFYTQYEESEEFESEEISSYSVDYGENISSEIDDSENYESESSQESEDISEEEDTDQEDLKNLLEQGKNYSSHRRNKKQECGFDYQDEDGNLAYFVENDGDDFREKNKELEFVSFHSDSKNDILLYEDLLFLMETGKWKNFLNGRCIYELFEPAFLILTSPGRVEAALRNLNSMWRNMWRRRKINF